MTPSSAVPPSFPHSVTPSLIRSPSLITHLHPPPYMYIRIIKIHVRACACTSTNDICLHRRIILCIPIGYVPTRMSDSEVDINALTEAEKNALLLDYYFNTDVDDDGCVSPFASPFTSPLPSGVNYNCSYLFSCCPSSSNL